MQFVTKKLYLYFFLFIILGLNTSCTLNYSITDLNSKSTATEDVASPAARDQIAPTLLGSITDGDYYTSTNQSPILSWSAGSDEGGSGILKYQISIGTTSGGNEILNWTDISNVTSYQISGLSLNEGVRYFPSIRVVDGSGNISTTILGDGWIPDATAPVIVSVQDGDQVVATSYSAWFEWTQASESLSGVDYYEVRIVDSANSPVTSWVNVGNALGYGFTGILLSEGQTYKAEVRAFDVAGNISAVVQGNGWYVVPTGWKQQAYIKAINADANDRFGESAAISGDTVVVGAYQEASDQTTIANGSTASSNNSVSNSGALYVYKRYTNNWVQEAYIKASNAESGDRLGMSVAIDKDTIIASAIYEDSNQTTITNGSTSSNDNSVTASGAVYVYKRSGATWAQEAYIKAANVGLGDGFGYSLAISGDTIVVGTPFESSNQTTITNGTSANADNSLTSAGAVYVYKRTGGNWVQEAFIKASNANANDSFGGKVAIFGDTIVVGAAGESSNQTTITNGTGSSADNSVSSSGAVYVYKRTGVNWAQEAFIKSPNSNSNDFFGASVAIFGDTVIVGATGEDSNQTTITNGTTASSDNSISISGAVYVFKRTGTTWSQEAFIKASNNVANLSFGEKVAIYGDVLVVGSSVESSNQSSITNGSSASSDTSLTYAGAAYVFKRSGNNWQQEAYIKAPNAGSMDRFSTSVSISEDSIIIGAPNEDSNQTSITNGNTASSDDSKADSGAVYIFNVDRNVIWGQQAYIKSSNSESNDFFSRVAIDRDTLVVGAYGEDSNQTTITNGSSSSSDNSLNSSGAVFVYNKSGNLWAQEAYLKPSNIDAGDLFGVTLAVSEDTIAVSSLFEASNQTFITNGSSASADNSFFLAGAVYIFKRTGGSWSQEAYIKPSNMNASDGFGNALDISKDTLVVSSPGEDSNQTTITNGAAASADNSFVNSGAVYVYKRSGNIWSQEAYIKAPNANANDSFGASVAIDDDTIVVGAYYEDSNQTTITNGASASADNSSLNSGAVYVFKRSGTTWTQEAFIKASNSDSNDNFGTSVDIYRDTIVAGAPYESSNQSSITNGSSASSNNSISGSGAVYVFKRSGVSWTQEAYIKPANPALNNNFGTFVSIFANTLVVGNRLEDGNQTTITNGTSASTNSSLSNSGAVYVYKRIGSSWTQESYIKAMNADVSDSFGVSAIIYGDSIAVGANLEDSNQTSITNGSTANSDNSVQDSGAVYIYNR